MRKFPATAIAALLSAVAVGQETDPEIETVIESGGRSVTFSEAVRKEHTGYDSPWRFSHAIRAGDFVYISGVIIGARGAYGYMAPDTELNKWWWDNYMETYDVFPVQAPYRMAQALLGRINSLEPSLKAWVYGELFVPWAGPLNGSLAFALAFVLLWMGLMWILYRRRIFIKV